MPDRFRLGRLLGNLAALLVLAIGGVTFADVLLTWFGGKPFVACAALPLIAVLTYTAAIGLSTIGVIIWVVSGFRRPTGLILAAGGIALGVAPGVIAKFLGLSCGG